MVKNMGSTDKIIRIILAIIFAYLYLSGTVVDTLGIVLMVLAVIFVLTSAIGFCPLYRMLGISTCKTKI